MIGPAISAPYAKGDSPLLERYRSALFPADARPRRGETLSPQRTRRKVEEHGFNANTDM